MEEGARWSATADKGTLGRDNASEGQLSDESGTRAANEGTQTQARNTLLETIIDHIPVMLVFVDNLGRVVSVNREFERVAGWASSELAGCQAWGTFFPEEPALTLVRDFMESAESGWREFSLTTKWGTSLESSWANVRLEDGSLIAIGIDIRAQRETAMRMAEMNRALQTRAEQLKSLALELTQAEQNERRRLAQILHDNIQQLLVGAKFRICALKTQLTDPRLGASLEDVHALITESIEVSRSLSHRLSPNVLYQAGLVPALEWLARHCLEIYNLEVELDLNPSVNPPSEAIRDLLFHSARELLFNVAKYSGTNRARLRLAGSGEFTEITVSDNGQGFNPSAARTSGGSGLIRIEERARLLGGMLNIDSEPGGGSRFTLVVPSGTPPVTAESEPAETRPAASSERTPNKRRKIRLMLVDDHNIVRQGLTLLLGQQQGLEVVGEASNGQEAVDLARILRPDVILMDVSMPVMDGVEATRLIKRENAGIEVIGLSTFSEKAIHKQMIEAGASGYVSKGGPSDVLAETIRQVCQRSQSPLSE